MIVLVGAEGAGLGDDTLALADVAVRIPIDAAVDSLNVVVAAGIALCGADVRVSLWLPASAGRLREDFNIFTTATAFRLKPEATKGCWL